MEYIDYTEEEIHSLHGGILKNKPFCSQYDFIQVDAKRMTARFHCEKDMFEWVKERAESIYYLLRKRNSDALDVYYARVILN